MVINFYKEKLKIIMKTFKRKLIAILMSVAIIFTGAAAFAACGFFPQNELRDLRQVVARVMLPGTDEEENIYKWQLIQAINSAFQGQQETSPSEQQVEQILRSLVDQRLISHEVSRMFERGDVIFRNGALYSPDGEPICAMHGMNGECLFCGTEQAHLCNNIDYSDENHIRRTLFNSIDQELAAIRREILTQHGYEHPVENAPATLPQPEFPIREQEESTYHTPELTLFTPDRANIPGTFGEAYRRSLEIEALRRFSSNIIQVVQNGVRQYNEERLQQDIDTRNEFLSNSNYEGLYLWLIDSYAVEQIGGNDIREQTKNEIVSRYLAENVEVTEADVNAAFRMNLEDQQFTFSRDAQAFASAVSGNQNILFRPNNNFFYVKHVLLPFTDAQTARLANFRARPLVTREEVEVFRNEQLVNEIRVHRRMENGFPNLDREYTAQEVLNEMATALRPLQNDLAAATRRFTDFIYQFNTDPGAFTHPLGYAMPHSREDGGQFMPEFEIGGWELSYYHAPGRLLERFVVTDFGVHIMFYSYNPPANEVALLHDYQTPAQLATWFEVFYDQIRETRERNEFQIWANRIITAARNNRDEQNNLVPVQVTYNRRFRDLVA